MTYKSILVQIDDDAACRPRLRAAAELGVRFGAHIIGLYVRQGLRIPTAAEIRDGSGLLEAQTAEAQHLERKAHAIFSEILASYAGPGYEWRTGDGIADEAFRRHSAYVDLLVVGLDKEQPKSYLISDEVLIGTARPVLLLPKDGGDQPVGHRVVAAWRNSREAARAINDALPFLHSASAVDIVSCVPPSSDTLPTAENIAVHLARHGISATTSSITCPNSHVGAAILAKVHDLRSDLLVMGAYGHSRLRETVWGGTTDYILSHLDCPIFMSH
ncbi:MAG: universal stress protein [Gammaproteobacteria bacterium]|nr:universal stress protein [Gammaproteobacteria bacterium]